MAKGKRKLGPVTKERVCHSLRLLAGRLNYLPVQYDLPRDVSEHLKEAETHLCKAFSKLENV